MGMPGQDMGGGAMTPPAAAPVPGKTDLPAHVAAQRNPAPKIEDRLPQMLTPPASPPIDTSFETVDTPAPMSQAQKAREMKRRFGQAMLQTGSPAQQVVGMKLLEQANRITPEEAAEAERQRLLTAVDEADTSDAAKARARTAIALGGTTAQVLEALEMDKEGLKTGAKAREKRMADLKKLASQTYAQGVMETMADRAIELIDESDFSTGAYGYGLSYLPFDNPGHNLAQPLDTLKAIVGFERLEQMREESPTGGALGQVSNMEIRFLQSTQGSLDQFQDSKALKANIRHIVESKKLFNELRSLVPMLDEGDEMAHERYMEIVKELGQVSGKMRTLTDEAERNTEVPPRNMAIERRYGM